jgi:SAM-dependent methyltransferase
MAKKSRIPFIFGSLWIAALILAAAFTAKGQELSKLPYVPTPQIVVDEMIRLAGVKADDFVVDLGSGDGRIIITAAKLFNASGFGVDIDGKLVALSNKKAKEAGVADRAQFFERDMFKTDIRKASVLMLYVLPDFMIKLRAKVLTELQPGSRVVAHDYYMGQWHPDRMVTLTVPEKVEANGTDKAYIYLWIVPAVVQGSWRIFFDTGGRTQEMSVTFGQQYQMIGATGEHAGKSITIEKATLKGKEISFALTFGATDYTFSGSVDGDKIEGKAIGGKETLNWLARKIP